MFEHSYGLAGVGKAIVFALAAAEGLLLIAFVLGLAQRFTCGAVLILHGLSTFLSFRQYFAPFEKGNILFFAAWPMLGACFALYYLRDLDTMRLGAARTRRPLATTLTRLRHKCALTTLVVP